MINIDIWWPIHNHHDPLAIQLNRVWSNGMSYRYPLKLHAHNFHTAVFAEFCQDNKQKVSEPFPTYNKYALDNFETICAKIKKNLYNLV